MITHDSTTSIMAQTLIKIGGEAMPKSGAVGLKVGYGVCHMIGASTFPIPKAASHANTKPWS